MTPLFLFTMLLAGSAPPDACHQIEADAIYGRDLFAAVPALAGLPPDAQVGYAPLPGMQRVFTPPELRRVAREHGIDPGGFLNSVCFTWPVAPLTASGFQQAAEKALAGRAPQIEIISWNLAPAPRGELVLPLTGLSTLSDKPAIWKGYVIYGGEKRFITWVNVRVSVGETHLILDQPLQAGEEPGVAGVHAELYRGPLQRERALTDVAQLKNVVARRNLPSGVTLVETMFEVPKEVQRGELVSVLVENGTARIETQGVAGQAGKRGDIIPVRNPKTGRTYRARIDGKGSVTVVPGGALGLVGEDSRENKS
ncbi:MAG TPA: flagellar basal body P-ring formation chaperone FlgA [Bryobacteraceae bacterium]|nr:flagellar basal body P-ring formation chaperone FlgA [Bryobacteraceae bacterium]